ncbi:hypothetical protein, partial [Halomonas urmiana]|uniref:hypothetical protein n=1 Tax=Halomonas urmiana TaxID=490901 RepID=UPI001305224E
LEAGSWKLEAGSWKLEAGSWKLEAGKQLAAQPWSQGFFFPLQAYSFKLPAKPGRVVFQLPGAKRRSSSFKL